MTTVRDNLIAARALIDTPEKWGKGEFEPSPGCYCALGAIAAVKGEDPQWRVGLEDGALARALGVAGVCDVADFNDKDTTTHADVMALFDRAISSQPTQEG